VRSYGSDDGETLAKAFEGAYSTLYSRVIPGVDIEVLSWVLSLSAPVETVVQPAQPVTPYFPDPVGRRALLDAAGETIEASLHRRVDLRPGGRIFGPAIITEDETSTVVSASFEAHVNGFGYIELRRRE
jgi:N-methylhydantoinase A